MKIDGYPRPPTEDFEQAEPRYQKLPGNSLNGRDLIELTVQDQSAADAINRLKGREAWQDQAAWEANVEHQWYPGGRPEGTPPGPPNGGNPGPFSPEPIYTNTLTGQELFGDILEGVMDQGGELNELRQFQNLRQEMPYGMDDQAKGVLAVADKYVALMESQGRTTLTPEEKAQMSAEMAAAAKRPEPIELAPPVIIEV